MSKKVTCSVSLKKNLGDYESFAITIGIEDEVRQGEKFSEAIDRVYHMAEVKLGEKMVNGLEKLNGGE